MISHGGGGVVGEGVEKVGTFGGAVGLPAFVDSRHSAGERPLQFPVTHCPSSTLRDTHPDAIFGSPGSLCQFDYFGAVACIS